MEEFREGSKRDPWIVQALAIDLPQEDLSQGDDWWLVSQNSKVRDGQAKIKLEVIIISSV